MPDTDSNPAATNTSPTKRLVFYVLLLVLVVIFLIITYCSLEALTKFVLAKQRGDEVVSFWKNDDLLAQSLKSNSQSKLTNGEKEFNVTIKTTSQGFRDIREYQIPKPKNTIRILMLGDSFTFGHGVEIEQTFSKVLEKSLNERYEGSGKNFEVINAGYASGFSWDEYYLFLKERGLKYQPDLVILNAWVGNDLTDIESHEYPLTDDQGLPLKIVSKTTFVDDSGFLEAIPPPIVIRPGLIGIKDRFNALCFKSIFCKTVLWPRVGSTTKAISQTIAEPEPASDPKEQHPSSPALDSPTETARESLTRFGPGFFMLNFLPAQLEPNIAAAWETGKKMLLAAKKISADAHAQLMIVDIPVKFEVYDEKGVFDDKKLFDRNRLETFAHENAIPYCSPLPLLRQAPDTTYFPYDSHLTALGHQAVAAIIESCLAFPSARKT